ncbi:hypothetical protein PHYPSEUDO_014873 [Phytophthora pseudosyringae]|uniref:Uncharacterized protein n=1 Tax=Phytophthora pseudosyringae TaxID=221518 RepID=A0A8T1W016_9STRA|nr:hypothetical protein PHYPSEUDO_014873 [Phytophthora pseudosyringae]
MFSYLGESSTSPVAPLMQCGYRSKVCTHPRATKIDGTLHKLCQFHRRKANLNQQRLHQRKREERARHRRVEVGGENRSAQCYVIHPMTTDPFPYEVPGAFGEENSPIDAVTGENTSSIFTPVDTSMVELLMQPLDRQDHNSSKALVPVNSIIV